MRAGRLDVPGHQKQLESPVFSLSSPKFRGHRLPFASLFVPNFPVQAVVGLEPELGGQPVAIFVGAPPLSKAFAVNREARNLGVETGVRKSPGGSVEGRCPTMAFPFAGSDRLCRAS